jgi:thiaminase
MQRNTLMSARYVNYIGRDSIYLLQSSSKLVSNMFKTKTLTTSRRIRAGRC